MFQSFAIRLVWRAQKELRVRHLPRVSEIDSFRCGAYCPVRSQYLAIDERQVSLCLTESRPNLQCAARRVNTLFEFRVQLRCHSASM